jgi:hypothetical protein
VHCRHILDIEHNSVKGLTQISDERLGKSAAGFAGRRGWRQVIATAYGIKSRPQNGRAGKTLAAKSAALNRGFSEKAKTNRPATASGNPGEPQASEPDNRLAEPLQIVASLYETERKLQTRLLNSSVKPEAAATYRRRLYLAILAKIRARLGERYTAGKR